MYHNSYSLHYLPYEDYVPHHPDSIALKSKVPTLPAAHLLVKAPHPHLRPHPHRPAPHHVSKRSADPHRPDPHHVSKRSAQGEFRMRSIDSPEHFLNPVDSFYLDQLTSPDIDQDKLVKDLLTLAFADDRSFNIGSNKPSKPNFGGGGGNKGGRGGGRGGNRGRGKGQKGGLFGGGNKGGLGGGGGKGGGGLFGGNKGGGGGGKGGGLFGNKGGLFGNKNKGRGRGQRPGQRPSYGGGGRPGGGSAEHGPGVIGQTSNSFPICTDVNKGSGPWMPCVLPGGELRGPGGLVVRPPESHPIVQIHVDDNSKIPDLAFYPLNSPIDKIASTGSTTGIGGGNNGRPSYNAPTNNNRPSYNAPNNNNRPSYNPPNNNNRPSYNAPNNNNRPNRPNYSGPTNNNLAPPPPASNNLATYGSNGGNLPTYGNNNLPSYNNNNLVPPSNSPTQSLPVPPAPQLNNLPTYGSGSITGSTSNLATGSGVINTSRLPGYNAASASSALPSYNSVVPNNNAITAPATYNSNRGQRLRKDTIAPLHSLASQHVSFPDESSLPIPPSPIPPSRVPPSRVPPSSNPITQIAKQTINQQEQFFQENPFLNKPESPRNNNINKLPQAQALHSSQENSFFGGAVVQALHTIPAPQPPVRPVSTGVRPLTNPLVSPLNHPIHNPTNPFLIVGQPAGAPVQPPQPPHSSTSFRPPPQQPASLPNVGFQPFTPAPWFFNGTVNSGTAPPPSTPKATDDFRPSPKVLSGVFTQATPPTNLAQNAFDTVTANPLAHDAIKFASPEEARSAESTLGASSVPLEAMTRDEIVQHFKIRENALQRLLKGIP